MNKMDFDSALRRQVMSLPELMRQQYADLEPKTRTVLSTPEIFNIQRIVLTGCGDSYAALLAVKPAFEKYAKIRTEVVPTIDLARDYEKKNLGYAPQSPLVIAVSNSGQVARVGEAVRRCRKAGAFTLGITGHEESVLGQSAERILKLDIPKFESAPGTRSYMVCVMALYLLAIRIGEVRGRYTMDVASARRKEIKALADALETALPAMDDTAFAVAQQWKDMDCYDFAGSGFEYACAFFGQAKVFEAIGRPAMYINTEEWLHLNFFVNHPEKIGTMIWAAGGQQGGFPYAGNHRLRQAAGASAGDCDRPRDAGRNAGGGVRYPEGEERAGGKPLQFRPGVSGVRLFDDDAG